MYTNRHNEKHRQTETDELQILNLHVTIEENTRDGHITEMECMQEY